jgi:hypothetical protein
MSLRGPLNALKTHLREALEGYHIRLINIRNQNTFADTTCYEVFYETNFRESQLDNIMTELQRLCPLVDFEWDASSYEIKQETKVVGKHIRTRFRHWITLMATEVPQIAPSENILRKSEN